MQICLSVIAMTKLKFVLIEKAFCLISFYIYMYIYIFEQNRIVKN